MESEKDLTQKPLKVPPKSDGRRLRVTSEELKYLQIPEIHFNAKLSAIPNTCKHKKFIQDYVDQITPNIKTPKGLLLFGDYGSGKSGIAAICLKAALSSGSVGLWLRASRVPEYQIEHVMFDADTLLYDRAMQVPILALDELIIRKDLKYTEQALELLIRHRVDYKLCTIITTNHDPSYIKEHYPALASPLLESVVPVKCTGHNFRVPIADNLKG
jgi:DNA replication protein DnaC